MDTELVKVTAYYERKVNLGNYESETYGAYISIPLSPTQASDGAIRLQTIDIAFDEARVAVEGAIAAGNGEAAPAAAAAPLAAVPAPAAPVAAPTPVDNVVAAFPGAQAVPAGPSPEHVQYLLDNNMTAELNEVYYDNRADIASGKASPKSPHFKDKATKQVPVWPLRDDPTRYAA